MVFASRKPTFYNLLADIAKLHYKKTLFDHLDAKLLPRLFCLDVEDKNIVV